MKKYIATIIILIFAFSFIFFVNNALKRENKYAWETADNYYLRAWGAEQSIKYIENSAFEEGYKNAIRDIENLFWCEDQINPPIEKCIGVFLDRDYKNLPFIER